MLVAMLLLVPTVSAWKYTQPTNPTINYITGLLMGNTSVNSTTIVTDYGYINRSLTVTASDANAIEIDKSGTGVGLLIPNTGTGHAIQITQTGDTSASTSTGGAMLLENTGNTGAGLIIYSNMNASASGRLLSVRADNAAFDESAVAVSYDGTSQAVSIANAGTGASNEALDVASTNTNYSAVGFSGFETNHGTLKVTHNYGTFDDSNAAAISINLDDVGTKAMGLYLYSVGNTTGNLIDLRNNGSEKRFSVSSAGKIQLLGYNHNGSLDQCTLSAGNCTINNIRVTAITSVMCTIQTPNAGVPGTPYIVSRVAGTSYSVRSTSATDASDVSCMLVEPIS